MYALDDPHFFTAHGDRFDFRGNDDTVYNLLSHANVSVNALFQTADYTSSGPRHKLVHGSFMRKAFVTVLTNMSHTLRVEYAAARPLTSKATVDGADISASGRSEVNIDNIAVSLNGRTLTIQTPEWLIRVSSKVNPSISNAPSCATGRCILNIQLAPLFDANHARVAPHGLIGQSYDGDSIAVIGQVPPTRIHPTAPVMIHTSALTRPHRDSPSHPAHNPPTPSLSFGRPLRPKMIRPRLSRHTQPPHMIFALAFQG